MRIVTGTNIYDKILDASIVTIGNFDGVHRGHAEVISHLKRKSKLSGLPSVVVTFEPHPLKILAPEAAPSLITTFEQKAALIEQYRIDYLVVIPFSMEFSKLTAKDFVLKILCDSLGMRHIIIGHDYAFGRDRLGNYATLVDMGAEYGFSIEDLEPFGDNGNIYSSSLARRMIGSGDMPGAASILGRYHVVSGRVVHGSEIGSRIGFPTANIETDNEMIPPDGVYAVMVWVGDKLVKGACSIGKNLTLDGNNRTIEVFLLDYSGQLYDSTLALCFVQRLRDMKKFSGLSELTGAIAQDVLNTRKILATIDLDLVKAVVKTGINEIQI